MARKRRGRPVHGWVIVDKPEGISSTAVVGRVRRAYDAQKAGHGGTLDPLATGLLPIALGEATKTVSWVMDGAKRYRFTAAWGAARETDDREGAVTATSDERPGEAAIRAALPAFTGTIEQRPPAYSAIKVDGKRAYDLARNDEAVELAPRPVEIKALELIDRPDADHAVFEVACGKGTYVRSLARDLGEALGCLGHVATLRRTAVGPFTERDAIALAEIEAEGHISAQQAVEPDGNPTGTAAPPLGVLTKKLLPVARALDDIPALSLTASEADRLRHGLPVPVLRTANLDVIADLADGETLWAAADDKPVALLRLARTGNIRQVHPVRVLNL